MSGGVHVPSASSSSAVGPGDRTFTAYPDEFDDAERQPLIRRPAPTRDENRERFQHNQRTAAQSVWQRSTCILLTVMVFIAVFFLLWAFMYYQAMKTWWFHGEKPCDQNLANWLLAMLIMPFFTTSAECCCRRLRIPVFILTIVVLFFGFHNFYYSKTCEKTNPELYAFIRRYLLFLAVWWIVLFTMPVVFLSVVIYGMWHGWFDEINGASPDTIKRIETVTYDASLFKQEGQEDDNRPDPECCVCTDPFDAGRSIKRTTCQHYFHEDCLGKWLRYSTTCPLCRNDLERPPSEEGDEAREVRALREMFPSLDQETATDAIRQSGGSAKDAVALLSES
mmetsp:Transcript_109333/g.172300  ORF Transcript_109333/g.172300 Transcript_109333/m.172300 type:complete len:337 (-) Transcript_109333:58-1068(-)|eukprot:CAMPEP_0169084810 /NCGR_PEP_ID=MMETSP1015-20121227/12824_1 /TAXON_ID=342587 /ORGANISM="Karlodinium micrum, Strain CCMP2283" /LENGTH=336 /DNA_ID=CAMNT_0009144853 /DNA_START=176 /DNA_END=1186 /DNA_ORIENTATION=-